TKRPSRPSTSRVGSSAPFSIEARKANTGSSSHAQRQNRRRFMGSKLYVGNLNYNTTSSQLEQLFAAHGTVQSAEVISDRETGRSKGFGFVQMDTEEAAKAAISALNGHEHDGRALTVNEAKPRENRPGGGGGGGQRRGG